MNSIDQSWNICSRRLHAELGDAIFTSWFSGLKLESVVSGRAFLSVSTRLLKSWIDSHYSNRILVALNSEIAGICDLELSVRSCSASLPMRCAKSDPSRRSNAAAADRSEPNSTPAGELVTARGSGAFEKRSLPDMLSGSPLDARLNFSNFLVGRPNQLAFTAAQQISDGRPGAAAAFNPLFIHASVGLGKTHLLQSIAHAATAQSRSVVYLTAERFMHDFVKALQTQTAAGFKQALRDIDLLIFDDAQFLQGKLLQVEFSHILNALVETSRHVVVASDRPPGDLEALEERVRSRLAGGLCLEMHPLDETLRLKILEAKIAAARLQNPQFEVSPPVLAFVARSIVSNGRDLEGAVNRLIAHSGVGRGALTLEAAGVAIRDLIRTHDSKRVRIEDIQKLVAAHYSVTRAEILSSCRTAVVVRPRHVAIYLAKMLTLRSLPEIGRRFGGRDHTTVLHCVRKMEGLASHDSALREELALLKGMLEA